MPDPFISVDDLSSYLGRDLSADDAAVMAIDAACDACRTEAEQSFNLGTATVKYDGTGTDAILLTERPVLNVGTVVVNGGTITDYTFNDRMLFRGSVGADCGWWGPVWPRGRQNVSVSYEFGYGTADVPRDVRRVALSYAARWLVAGVATSETVGDVTLNYGDNPTDFTPGELRILYKYRQARSF